MTDRSDGPLYRLYNQGPLWYWELRSWLCKRRILTCPEHRRIKAGR